MIKKTPYAERPRERCLKQGASSLSLRECLAIILGSGPSKVGCLGVADQILKKQNCFPEAEEERAFFLAMESTGLAHLHHVHGLGPAGKSKILASFELARRYAIFTQKKQNLNSKPIQLTQTAQIALKRISSYNRNEPKEWLGFVPLYRNAELGELCLVEKGSRTHVNIDPAELFARILALRPAGFFLFHNHPSGDSRPSSQDIELTDRIRKISRPLGVQLLGHWVVSPYTENWLD